MTINAEHAEDMYRLMTSISDWLNVMVLIGMNICLHNCWHNRTSNDVRFRGADVPTVEPTALRCPPQWVNNMVWSSTSHK